MFADFSGGGRQTSISMLSRCCFTWWRTTTNLPSSPSSFSLLFFLLRTLETTIFLLVFNCFPALPVTGQPNNFMMFPHPQPTLFLHEGHISMLESLTPIPQFNGAIVPGSPYSLDIQMGNTGRFDYIIERCTYNTQKTFIDTQGCPHDDTIFIKRWETNNYAPIGAVKRTLIHFVTSQPITKFECQLKVVECRGCCQQSCDRRPPIGAFYPSSYVVPLACAMPTPLLPAAPLPRPYSYWAATTAGYQQFFDSLPYWIWVPLLLLLIILPLLIMACLGCCCLLARSRGRKRKVAPISDVKSSMMPIPPPPAKIYISEASQTMPSAADNILNGRRENNVSSASAEERFFMDERNNGVGEYRSSKTAAFEDHGEFSLRDKKPASKPTRFSISRRPRDHHEEHMMDVGGYERPATPHQNYTTKSSEVWKEEYREEYEEEEEQEPRGPPPASTRYTYEKRRNGLPRTKFDTSNLQDRRNGGIRGNSNNGGGDGILTTSAAERHSQPRNEESQDFWSYRESDGENVREETVRRVRQHTTVTSLV